MFGWPVDRQTSLKAALLHMRLSDFWKIDLALGLFQIGRTFHAWDEPKLSELSWWKVRRLAHLSLGEWDQIVQKRFRRLLQTDTERLKIVSVANVELHMRQINW